MFGLHRHQFVEVERFYALPVARFKGGEGLTVEAVKVLLLGITTIHSRCTICPEERFKEVYGKSTRETDND